MTEDMLNEFPEEMKKVFGISTLGQKDLNRVRFGGTYSLLDQDPRNYQQVSAKGFWYRFLWGTKWVSFGDEVDD